VLAARRIPDAGLAQLRRQGMAAWIWGSATSSISLLPMPAAAPRQPTEGAPTRNELTLILASLVVALMQEPTYV
jgi:hypothetical protein